MDSGPKSSKRLSEASHLSRNAVDVLPVGELERKLDIAARENRRLTVKLGIDPTAPDIHLGHMVVLQKLREFQDRGHRVVLIVGDFTARVGDPSGRSKTRPVLSDSRIERNAATFQEQACLVLDPRRTEVRRNSEWLDMSMSELFSLARTTTVARLLERDDFANRYRSGRPISVLELLYPLMQAYDSAVVKADVEIGGTDQKFNLLLGRTVQEAYGVEQQVILTMPILPGTDGVERMSKSSGNYVGVTEPPAEQFGKIMSIPDEVMPEYYRLLLGVELDQSVHPATAKRTLARAVVARFCGQEAADRAAEGFDAVHKRRELPDHIPEISVEQAVIAADGRIHLPGVLAASFGQSKSQARRLIDQGGVKVNGRAVSPGEYDWSSADLDEAIIQVGKRRFARITGGPSKD